MQRIAVVVEDDSAVRRLVTGLLKAEGFQVLEAKDGADAIAFFGRSGQVIDLVVTDIRMERVDGVSLYETVSARYGTLPFIFVTGHPGDERIVSVPSNLPILTKPFLINDLTACVRQLLRTETAANRPSGAFEASA
jgi:DNA-binding response OmpR family regulator